MGTHFKALKTFLQRKWPSFLSSRKLAFNFIVIDMCHVKNQHLKHDKNNSKKPVGIGVSGLIILTFETAGRGLSPRPGFNR